MRLYGNDIDDTTTVLEADLGVDRVLDEGRLHRPRGAGRTEGRRGAAPARRIRDARPRDRPARAIPSSSTAKPAGVVTSGTQTPFLKKAIGMAYVPASTPPDADIAIDIRNRRGPRAVVPLPFYKRPRK